MVKRRKHIEKEIIIGYTELKISLPLFIAKSKKIFSKYGFNNIVFRAFDTAEHLIEAIINREINLGGYCALPVAFTKMSSSGIEFVFVGGILEDDNHKVSYLIKRKGLDINSLNVLENLKIGYFPTDAYKIWLKRFFKSNGIKYEIENFKPIIVSEQYEALKNGNVDILLTNDPIATQIFTDKIGLDMTPDDAVIPDAIDINPFYYGSFIVSKDYADNNPEILKRISLVLDDAIDMIKRIEKKSGSAKPAFNEFLGGKINDVVLKELSICNYKKTNEISNDLLNEIRRYYHNQDIFKKKINTKGLQYKLETFYHKIVYFLDGGINYYKENQAILNLLAIIFGSVFAYYQTNKTINSEIKQYQKKLIQDRKTIPAQFIIKFEDINTDNERAYLINTGYSTLIRVSADLDYYFITKDDKVYLASILYKSLNDTILKNKLLSSNKINKLQDLKGMLNTFRPISTNDILNPFEGNNLNQIIIGKKNNISFNNSSSILKNLIDVNDLLQSKLIARWKIEYFEEISREKKTVYKYYLFTENEMLLDKFETRRIDLERVLGGKRIIELINNYEKNTKQIIFE